MKPISVQRPKTQHYENDKNFDSLPNLTDTLKMKQGSYDHSELMKRLENLQKLLQYKHKQIEQLEFMLHSLQVALNQRDIIIVDLRSKNIELKDKNVEFQEFLKKHNLKGVEYSQLSKTLQEGLTINQSQQFRNIRKKKSQYDQPESSKLDATSKRLMRARTKENNFDEGMKSILEFQFDGLQDYQKKYQDLQHIQLIKNVTISEETFLSTIQKLDFSGVVSLFDSVQLVLQEHRQLFFNTIKQQRLLQCSINLGESSSLNDQLKEINQLLCNALECDKVSIFVLDNEKEELWTKNYKNDIIHRIHFNEDVTGICFQTRQVINVNNAYNDLRFKKENDVKYNYKTITLLVCPILDKRAQNSIGIIQAYNKSHGHFNNDDIIFIQNVSSILSVLLRSQQQQDEAVLIQNQLRNIFKITINFMKKSKLKDILREAEQELSILFHVQKARVYYFQNDQIIRVNDQNNVEKFEKNIGIIGETLKTREIQLVQNLYNHKSFNNRVDIETSMPIICLPIILNDEVQLVLQVINSKSIRSNKVKALDQEVLETFGLLVVNLLRQAEENEKLQSFYSFE